MHSKTSAVLLFLLAANPLFAQRTPPEPQATIEAELRERLARPGEVPDIDLIMLGEDYSGAAPRGVRWSLDGKALLFEWKRWSEKERGTYRYDVETHLLERLPDDEDRPFAASDVLWAPGGKKGVVSRDGDLFLVSAEGSILRRLTETSARESARIWSADGKRLVFRRGDDLFAFDLEDAALRQLTRFGPVEKKKEEKSEGAKFLASEERQLLRLVDTWARKRAEREEKAKKRREKKGLSYEIPKGYELGSVNAGPLLDRLYVVIRKKHKTKRTLVPKYVTQDAYVATTNARPKVGDHRGADRLVTIDVATGKARDVALPSGDRDAMVFGFRFSESGRHGVCTVRTWDNKDLYLVSLEDGAARPVHHVHDDAWVLYDFGGGFLPGREVFWFKSEKTGFQHIYAHDFSSNVTRTLTEGSWLVDRARYHRGLDRIVIQTTQVSPFERHVYLLDPATGERERITKKKGWHEVVVSPDGRSMAESYSFSNVPWEVYVSKLGSGGLGLRVTKSPSPAFAGRDWFVPAIERFQARDGVAVPMRVYAPDDPKPGGPAVVFVHGAGYLQNVHRRWSSYFREYMFHNLLREAGYWVIDVDYRGSAGYGRDWRCAIYRHMGGKDLTDQVDAVAWLVKNKGVDPGRVGLYGGSYGGFITLMALFRTPEIFACGAALRPVTDWAHYNHGYTANILNVPTDDKEAYRFSSPIWHAQGLRGRLLICHGLVDDNVQVQDVMRLVQRLIELRKSGWEMALYPVERHGFRDPASWADEYRRIRGLFRDVLGL